MDLVAQYVKGIDLYRCSLKGDIIVEPFWEKCERYKRRKKLLDNDRNFIKLR